MLGLSTDRATPLGNLQVSESVAFTGSCNSRQLVELARFSIPSLPENEAATVLISGSVFYNLADYGMHRNDLLFIENASGPSSYNEVILTQGDHLVQNGAVTINSYISIFRESWSTFVLKAYGSSIIKVTGGTNSRMMEIRIEAVASVLTCYLKNAIYGCMEYDRWSG